MTEFPEELAISMISLIKTETVPHSTLILFLLGYEDMLSYISASTLGSICFSKVLILPIFLKLLKKPIVGSR